MLKSEAINELAAALSKAQGAMTPAIKDSNNPFFKSQYADLASVWDACRKPLTDNGLSVVQTLDAENKLETILLHSSGQYITSTLAITAKEQTSQSIGSAITYARRYALSAMVGICPDDDDGEAAMGRKPARTKQPEETETAKQPEKSGDATTVKDHWCKIHNTAFFKTEKMRSWAHPIPNSKEWCYEHSPTPPSVMREIAKADAEQEAAFSEMQSAVDAGHLPAQERQGEPVTGTVKGIESPSLTVQAGRQVVEGIDMDGVRDLQSRIGYKDDGFIGWMKNKNYIPRIGSKVKTPTEALNSLTLEKRQACVEEFQAWVEASGR